MRNSPRNQGMALALLIILLLPIYSLQASSQTDSLCTVRLEFDTRVRFFDFLTDQPPYIVPLADGTQLEPYVFEVKIPYGMYHFMALLHPTLYGDCNYLYLKNDIRIYGDTTLKISQQECRQCQIDLAGVDEYGEPFADKDEKSFYKFYVTLADTPYHLIRWCNTQEKTLYCTPFDDFFELRFVEFSFAEPDVVPPKFRVVYHHPTRALARNRKYRKVNDVSLYTHFYYNVQIPSVYDSGGFLVNGLGKSRWDLAAPGYWNHWGLEAESGQNNELMLLICNSIFSGNLDHEPLHLNIRRQSTVEPDKYFESELPINNWGWPGFIGCFYYENCDSIGSILHSGDVIRLGQFPSIYTAPQSYRNEILSVIPECVGYYNERYEIRGGYSPQIRLLDASGSDIYDGTLVYQSGSYIRQSITPQAVKVEISNPYGSVAGKACQAKLQMDIDLRREDNTAPVFSSFHLVDQINRPADKVSGLFKLIFTVADYRQGFHYVSLPPDSVRVFYRQNGTSQWHPMAVRCYNEEKRPSDLHWRFKYLQLQSRARGLVMKAEQAIESDGTAFYDIKIEATDASGNRSQWTMEPAFLQTPDKTNSHYDHDGVVEPLPVFPNPFNESTHIRFRTDGFYDLYATVTVYDLRGRICETLLDGPISIGLHDLTWHPGDLPSGVYIIRIKVGDDVRHIKCTRLR